MVRPQTGGYGATNDGAIVYHEGPALSREDLAAVVARIAERMLRWMRQR